MGGILWEANTFLVGNHRGGIIWLLGQLMF
jgi:hypothetical protein